MAKNLKITFHGAFLTNSESEIVGVQLRQMVGGKLHEALSMPLNSIPQVTAELVRLGMQAVSQKTVSPIIAPGSQKIQQIS